MTSCVVSNLNYIIMAIKAGKLAKERKNRVEAAQITVETKQLSLRVAEERFDVTRSTIHGHASSKYSKIGAGRLTF